MKITPIEIRQHTFQKTLRGYDVEEVGAFLSSLSNEWERVVNETKMLKMQLEIAEKELAKLREVELTMFRMLKNAEDTSSQMTEQAKNAGEQYIGEARTKSEEMMTEAQKRAKMVVLDAENQAKYVREETLNEFKNIERDFKAMEKYRDNLLVQLKTLANNTVDSVERFEKKFAQNMTKERISELREHVTNDVKPQPQQSEEADDDDENAPLPTIDSIVTEEESPTTEEKGMAMASSAVLLDTINQLKQHETANEESDETTGEKKEGSFFDQVS